MMDSKTTKITLDKIAKLYQKTKDERVLYDLNDSIWEYLMKKTYRGLTDNITFSDRKLIATNTITKLITEIKELDLDKYTFVSILANTFKQLLLKYYKKQSRYVFWNNDTFDKQQIKRYKY